MEPQSPRGAGGSALGARGRGPEEVSLAPRLATSPSPVSCFALSLSFSLSLSLSRSLSLSLFSLSLFLSPTPYASLSLSSRHFPSVQPTRSARVTLLGGDPDGAAAVGCFRTALPGEGADGKGAGGNGMDKGWIATDFDHGDDGTTRNEGPGTSGGMALGDAAETRARGDGPGGAPTARNDPRWMLCVTSGGVGAAGASPTAAAAAAGAATARAALAAAGAAAAAAPPPGARRRRPPPAPGAVAVVWPCFEGHDGVGPGRHISTPSWVALSSSGTPAARLAVAGAQSPAWLSAVEPRRPTPAAAAAAPSSEGGCLSCCGGIVVDEDGDGFDAGDLMSAARRAWDAATGPSAARARRARRRTPLLGPALAAAALADADADAEARAAGRSAARGARGRASAPPEGESEGARRRRARAALRRAALADAAAGGRPGGLVLEVRCRAGDDRGDDGWPRDGRLAVLSIVAEAPALFALPRHDHVAIAPPVRLNDPAAARGWEEGWAAPDPDHGLEDDAPRGGGGGGWGVDESESAADSDELRDWRDGGPRWLPAG